MKKQVLTIISLKNNEEHSFSFIEAIGYDDYKAALAAIEHIKFGKCDDFELPSSCYEDGLIVEYFLAVGYKVEKDLDDNLIEDIFDGVEYTRLSYDEDDYVLESSYYDYKIGGSFDTSDVKKYNSWDEVMKNLYHTKKQIVESDICNGCNNLDNDSYGLTCMLVRGCNRETDQEYER